MNREDSAHINELVAKFYNENLNYNEIAERILESAGANLNYEQVRNRVRELKKKGRLDYTRTQVDIDSEESILDEVEREAGGLFKIGVLDIETTGFWADFGYVLVAVIKDMETGEYDVFRLDEMESYKDPKNRSDVAFWRRIDYELLIELREAYEKYDIIVHFNGRNFDIKFLNTRMIKNGIHLLPDMKQLDIYQIAKHRLRLRSKRLDALKEFLEIDELEDGHRWEYWQMAANGQKVGFDFVVDHCKRDVDRLSQVARRMKAQINFIKK